MNSTVLVTRVETFLCPTDRHFSRYGNNYRANVGYDIHTFRTFRSTQPSASRGAFRILRASRASEYTDGLSRTVGWRERSVGNGDHQRFVRSRDFWFAGMGDDDELETTGDELLEICGLATSDPAHVNGRLGEFWFCGGSANGYFNHAFPPNARIPDCSSGRIEFHAEPHRTYALSARSFHSGGVHTGFMDGSVRFVRDSVSLQVWRAASTRAGNESAEGL